MIYFRTVLVCRQQTFLCYICVLLFFALEISWDNITMSRGVHRWSVADQLGDPGALENRSNSVVTFATYLYWIWLVAVSWYIYILYIYILYIYTYYIYTYYIYTYYIYILYIYLSIDIYIYLSIYIYIYLSLSIYILYIYVHVPFPWLNIIIQSLPAKNPGELHGKAFEGRL